MNDDDDLLGELGRALGHDPERQPPPDRVAAVRAAASSLGGRTPAAVPVRSRRGLLLAGGVAAGFGGVAGYLVRDAGVPEPPPAPPVEAIALDAAEGVSATGGLVNHTWGTELLLDVTGLAAGTTYDVGYGLTDGSTVPAGSLLGVADVVMRCRFNAAPLRADVGRIVVTDPDGRAVVSTVLPAVEA